MSVRDDTTRREEGMVLLERTGAIAQITLSRPSSLNALTWAMYEQIETHLKSIASDDSIRVVVMRGAGKAFAAGTDIAQFHGYSGQDGIVYESKMEAIIEGLYNFTKPTIAAVHGYAIGAGIVLSSVCDLRFATPAARFGAPIARTLGNALSIKNYQHIAEAFGEMRAKEMLLTARLFSAEEALHCGFLTAIIEEERLYAHVMEVAQQISTLAPLTIWASKEAHRRLHAQSSSVPFNDVIARVYGSQDFAEGVQAHLDKRKPQWRGR